MSEQERTLPLLSSNEVPQMGNERSAFLRVNQEEMYAQIVFSDGKCSRKFISKETGLFLLSLALKAGIITAKEVRAVEEQLFKSSLPERDSLIIDLILITLDNSDEESDEGDEEEEEDDEIFDLGPPPPPEVVRNN